MISHAKLRRSWVVAVMVCLVSCGLIGDKSVLLSAAAGQADEEALYLVVGKFFDAYGRNDLDGLMALWSGKSPDFDSSKQNLGRQFAVEDYAFGGRSISRVKVEGEKAGLRATVDLTAINRQSQQRRTERLVRSFGFAKEGGEWKVWRYAPAANDLAESLAKAKSESEREALLAEESELVTPSLVLALDLQGARLINQRDFPQALAILRLAHGIAERIADKPGIALTLRDIGNVHFSKNEYQPALEYFQKSLTTSEEADDKSGIGRALTSIGNVHLAQGDQARAAEFLRKSLSMLAAIGDKAAMASTLGNIALIYIRLGNYVDALEYLHKGLEMSDPSVNKTVTARTLTNIGTVHVLLGDYDQAVKFLQESLELHESLNDQPAVAAALNNTGLVHNNRGNYIQAMEHFQKSLEISEKLDDKAGVARALSNIGMVYNSQGNYEQALEYYRKNLEIVGLLDRKDSIALALNNIGVNYSSQDDHARALEYLRKSMAMHEAAVNRAGMAAALSNIGDAYSAQGKPAEALECLQKSLTIKEALRDKAGVAFTLNGIGDVHRKQGRHTESLDYAGRAAALAGQIGSIDTLWRAHFLAGAACRAIKEPARARQALDDSIAVIEAMRKQLAGGEQEAQRFFENKLSPYLATVDLLVEQNNFAGALTYAERAKARVLLDVLHSGRANVYKAMTGEERGQERQLNNQVISLNTQIRREKLLPQPDQPRLLELNDQLRKVRIKYEAFQTSLYTAHPELKTQRGEAQPLTLEQAGALLPDTRTALLEFVVAEDKSFLFVLTKNASSGQTAVALKVFPLAVGQKELTQLTGQFRRQLTQLGSPAGQMARKLHDLLLKDAESSIRGKDKLVIVPDGPLWEMPFQALLSSRNRYLVQDHAVAYVPSLSVLSEMIRLRRRDRGPAEAPTLLAIGNPALGKEVAGRRARLMSEALEPMPEAERQVESLKRLYGPLRSRTYIRSDATEERVKAEAGDHNVLHIASHGVLNDRSPMYSHLVLAQTDSKDSEDGLLEAWEIMNLNLKTDLAVLSACETARGRVGAGEGTIGLTWALFVAGVPATVVSQWKVRSDSTAVLMVEFHRQLRMRDARGASQVTKAEALRRAALKLIGSGKYRHPFHWASFVLVGDGF